MRTITNLINWLTRQIRDQLGFTHAEASGMLALLLLISCLLAIPPIIKWYDEHYHLPNYNTDITLLNNTLIQLQKQEIKNDIPAKHLSPSPTKTTNQPGTYSSFNINIATAQKLQSLPGIGTTWAARIIKYREKLGGFVRSNQYAEVYGLDSRALGSLLQYSHIAPKFQPRKLHLNQDNFKALLKHPYLSYDQVKKIIQSRERQGKFTSIQELLQRGVLDKDTFDKVKAYLII